MTESYQTFIEQLFIKYAKVNTRSDENSQAVPTTPGQVALAKIVLQDLKRIGVEDVVYDPKDSYVVASLPANTTADITPVGFIAHLDTADFPAENVLPQVHENYDGQDLVLNEEKKIVLRVSEFPNLRNYRGQRLITSDGTTLLGVDDKAGIASILTAVKYLLEHPTIKHGPVSFAFGPDEEIGRGAKRFDVSKFKVKFAYTLDNGLPGQLENETFNAAQAKIKIKGTSVHPGNAFGLMVNAITLANQIISLLPADEVPEKSCGHQGFFLVTDFKATIAQADLNIIIRDFDQQKFAAKKELLQQIVTDLNQQFERPRINLELKDQYFNIGDAIQQHPYITELVLNVYHKLGLKTQIHPFRGGTDGNFITAKGIPTPNLFNGGENFHGPYEFVTTEAMLTTSKTVVEIIKEHAQNDRFEA
ncbi:MAG: peptidase T [Liquorilactobacillus nagelii]|uniref:peptidase T n=1 Tax=Liquorilactobacillus nagelii TaxID=82688 RepID=UPI0039E75067